MLAYEQLLAEGYVVSRDRSTNPGCRRRAFPSAGRAAEPSRHGPCKGLGLRAAAYTQEPRHAAVGFLREPPGTALRLSLRPPRYDEFSP